MTADNGQILGVGTKIPVLTAIDYHPVVNCESGPAAQIRSDLRHIGLSSPGRDTILRLENADWFLDWEQTRIEYCVNVKLRPDEEVTTQMLEEWFHCASCRLRRAQC